MEIQIIVNENKIVEKVLKDVVDIYAVHRSGFNQTISEYISNRLNYYLNIQDNDVLLVMNKGEVFTQIQRMIEEAIIEAIRV